MSQVTLNIKRLGRRIRAQRIALGLTHPQLQRALKAEGVDRTTTSISYWENGHVIPELEVVMALSRVFGVSIDDLIKKGV